MLTVAEARVEETLSTSAARLSAYDARLGFDAGAPVGDGWYDLTRAAVPHTVAGWLDELPASRQRLRNVATSRTALSLACCVVRPVMAMLHLERQVPALTATDTWVLRVGTTFDRLALRSPRIYGPPDGTASTLSEDDLLERAALEIHGVLEPVFETLRQEGRYGHKQLWGGALDMIGATSLLVARLGGLSRETTWAKTERLCAYVERLVHQHRPARPTTTLIACGGGDELMSVKGTCCLKYREFGLRVGEATDTTSYCKTCPYIPADVRQDRTADDLERDLRSATRPYPPAEIR